MLKHLALIFLTLLLFPVYVHAQELPSDMQVIQTQQKGTITSVQDDNIEIKLTNDDVVSVYKQPSLNGNTAEYKVGDQVFVLQVSDASTGYSDYYITDHNRTSSLRWLFVLFVLVVLGISKKWGIFSLVGMVYSFFVIFKFILPQLLSGHSPLLIAVIGSLLIAPVTFYLSHGFKTKTTVALISTLISVLITGILAHLFINVSKLTGFGTEEAYFLQIAKDGLVNIKGLFLAGIIISSLGILDDITVTQSAIVFQLKNSIKHIDNFSLYKKAMEVGHDHIASTVNTLVLVYTGAALPLLLLFLNSSTSFSVALNSEIIADEIVRTLVGSIGIVLAVPISTMIAVFFSDKREDSEPELGDSVHFH